MNKLLLYGACLYTVIMTACSGGSGSQTATGTVDIAGAMKHPGEVTTSQLGSKISFIPLETNDSSLIGGKWIMKVADDKVIFSNTGQVVLSGENVAVNVFDVNTGRYVSSPGRVGQGPEDRSNGFVWTNKKANRMYSKAGNGNGYVVYTTDGKFAGKMTDGSKSSSFFTDSDTTVTLLSNDTGDQSRELVLYTYSRTGTLLDSCLIFSGQEMEPVSWKFDGPLTIITYDESGFPLSNQSVTELKTASGSTIIPSIPANQLGDEMHITQTMCDTIYRISARGAEPVVIFDFGENGFPFREFNKRLPNNNEMYVTHALETPDKVLFAFSEGWLGDDSHKEYIGIYDRKSGKTIVGDAKKGIRDDLGGFMPFSPSTTTADGKWIGVLTMEQIEEWLEENPEVERPEWLANSTAEDNPVLVIISD